MKPHVFWSKERGEWVLAEWYYRDHVTGHRTYITIRSAATVRGLAKPQVRQRVIDFILSR